MVEEEGEKNQFGVNAIINSKWCMEYLRIMATLFH
jgi:hypothetical protein